MPFVNVKLVKGQITSDQRQDIIAGLTELIVKVMGRERELIVIILDELEKINGPSAVKPLNRQRIMPERYPS
jgi:4-oxalocrotonate tautomerase